MLHNILRWLNVLWLASGSIAISQSQAVRPLIEASCLDCHSTGSDTGFDLETLASDLSNSENFDQWVKVYDRVQSGEMPPASEERPDPELARSALAALRRDLEAASQSQQARVGRVPARRLTKLEFGYTLRDLLHIESDVTQGIPDEVDAGSFDTVGVAQRISAVHMESYLAAADRALSLALQVGRNPYHVGVSNYDYLEQWHDKPLNLGGSVTRKLKNGKGIALFADIDYLTKFQFEVSVPGMHRITAKVAAYQSRDPVTAKIIVKNPAGGAALVKAVDLDPGDSRTVVVDSFLQPGDIPYLTFENRAGYRGVYAAGGSKNYRGPGLAILSQKIEGPLHSMWPPESTRQLLYEPTETAAYESKKMNLQQVSEVLERLGPRVFRRSLMKGEIEHFAKLALPAIKEGRDWPIKIPLRAMLSSPQFLLFGGEPGYLDDYALASRLSYFLWKSMPDDQLFKLAHEGRLSDSKVLAEQVERMLEDDKSERFVKDFVGQWLRLYKLNVTTPDDGLYPEFDELLSNAIPTETELFFSHLIEQNLSLANMIESDFIFVNRRLAEHYGIDGVRGQEFRKISLKDDSPRGGVLTQAAILKTTANGTTTSPVMRGNFVLTNFLGTPPSPPPPDIGSIEPDTRGQTTIREILAAHREIETCNQCHREIDPPGFALESFDPIGGYREHYRASGGEQTFGGFTMKLPPRQGPAVDASGVTSDGTAFKGISEFKSHLLKQKDQVARNFIAQLIVYATGGEIQFADRQRIESILDRTREKDFPVRDLIHAVVQSDLFRKM